MREMVQVVGGRERVRIRRDDREDNRWFQSSEGVWCWCLPWVTLLKFNLGVPVYEDTHYVICTCLKSDRIVLESDPFVLYLPPTLARLCPRSLLFCLFTQCIDLRSEL